MFGPAGNPWTHHLCQPGLASETCVRKVVGRFDISLGDALSSHKSGSPPDRIARRLFYPRAAATISLSRELGGDTAQDKAEFLGSATPLIFGPRHVGKHDGGRFYEGTKGLQGCANDSGTGASDGEGAHRSEVVERHETESACRAGPPSEGRHLCAPVEHLLRPRSPYRRARVASDQQRIRGSQPERTGTPRGIAWT